MNYEQILSRLSISELNAMQKEALEMISKNDHVVLISPTGTGKTLAFLLPCLPFLKFDEPGVQLLVIVPTRELAIQIEQVLKKMGTAYKINSCYGGHSVGIEENNLLQPPAILIGTPGRIGHHLRAKNLSLQSTHTLILDEFDKSLEAGFDDDMSYIIAQCPALKRRILTSATSLVKIPSFVGMKHKAEINHSQNKQTVNESLKLKSVRVKGDDKLEALMLLLGKTANASVIVFCNHREAVNRISEQLEYYKIEHGFYHGGLDQMDREKTLIKFRNESIRILITTDLAARGLDIPEIETVIHYQLPLTEDVMIHRNGRTARMNAEGTVYFLLDVDDHLPKFLNDIPEEEELPGNMVIPEPAQWKTVYISAGKKDKINKMDIVGMLIQKGRLLKEDIGKIEVLDHSAYVAINSTKLNKTLPLIREEKIKNKKVKIGAAS